MIKKQINAFLDSCLVPQNIVNGILARERQGAYYFLIYAALTTHLSYDVTDERILLFI